MIVELVDHTVFRENVAGFDGLIEDGRWRSEDSSRPACAALGT